VLEAARRVQISGHAERQARQPKGAPDRNNDGKGDGGQFALQNEKLKAAVSALNRYPKSNPAAAARDLDDNELFADREDIQRWVSVAAKLLEKVTIQKKEPERKEPTKPVKKERTGAPNLNIPALNATQVGKLLNAMGWTAVRKVGSHRVYAKPGEAEVITVPEHGSESLGKGLLIKILKQGGVPLERFQEAHSVLSNKPVGEKLSFDQMLAWLHANYELDKTHKIPKRKGTNPLKHTLWQEKRHLQEGLAEEGRQQKKLNAVRPQPVQPVKGLNDDDIAFAKRLRESRVPKRSWSLKSEAVRLVEERSRRDPDTRSGNPHHGVETGRFASPGGTGGDAARLGKELNRVRQLNLRKGEKVAVKRGENHVFGTVASSFNPAEKTYKVDLEDGRTIKVPADDITHEQGRAEKTPPPEAPYKAPKRKKPNEDPELKKRMAAFAQAFEGFEHQTRDGLQNLRIESVKDNSMAIEDGKGGYRVRNAIRARIVNEDGAEVGYAVRRLQKDAKGRLFVVGETIRLHEDYQGEGFATALSHHVEKAYKEMGVHRIEIKAGFTVGGYAWARSGYSFGRIADEGNLDYTDEQLLEIGREQARITFNAAHRRLQYLVGTGYVEQADVDEMEALVNSGDIYSPQQLALFGRDKQFFLDAGDDEDPDKKEKMWLGKWMMLESQWVGVKYL
jgi:predicted RNA binding protein YcfA (HicA-like mRNA interferase family)/GNAT superfamily N-acetyltransferase